MLLHGKVASSEANGPGARAVIWFQGCTLNCAGCQNPGSHSFDAPETDENEVIQWLLSLEGIEGVTFSGGEPMQHYPALFRLILALRYHRPALSIGMFTGYTLRELERGSWIYRSGSGFVDGSAQQWQNIRERVDFAICGRYNAIQDSSTKPLCGSANQTLELFSERYTLESFSPQVTEVIISDELVTITGFPGTNFLTE